MKNLFKYFIITSMILSATSMSASVVEDAEVSINQILEKSKKLYTLLKIDEVNNLGAAKIRIRSLLAALKVKEKQGKIRKVGSSAIDKVQFTEEMRKEYTILCPQLSPIHFDLLQPVFEYCGYNFEVLNNDNKTAVDIGLKYVNNDACYPSLLVVGQLMQALLSGKYDIHKTALIITQTGGGCRATNYIGFIRRALEKAGMAHIPVISLNLGGIEVNPGFKVSVDMLYRAILGCTIGDIFMRCVYRMRPYELTPGSVDAIHQKWTYQDHGRCGTGKRLHSDRRQRQDRPGGTDHRSS